MNFFSIIWLLIAFLQSKIIFWDHLVMLRLRTSLPLQSLTGGWQVDIVQRLNCSRKEVVSVNNIFVLDSLPVTISDVESTLGVKSGLMGFEHRHRTNWKTSMDLKCNTVTVNGNSFILLGANSLSLSISYNLELSQMLFRSTLSATLTEITQILLYVSSFLLYIEHITGITLIFIFMSQILQILLAAHLFLVVIYLVSVCHL